jgi:hypothetical protein
VAADVTVPGEHIGGAGEHEVYHNDGSDRVWKSTNNRQFGYVVDQTSDNKRNKLALRPALPSEYLLRLGSQNLVFGDRIVVEGKQNIRPGLKVVEASTKKPSTQEVKK